MRVEASTDLALAGGALALGAVTCAVLARMRFGSEEFLRGSLRSALQLGVLGLLLAALLPRDVWPWQVVGLILLAFPAAASTAGRLRRRVPCLRLLALLPALPALPLLSLPVLVPDPSTLARGLFLPLAGFLMGTGLGGAVAFVNRFAALLTERRSVVEVRLALGAEPREAAADLYREAGRAALRPALQSLAVVGLTQTPAMLAGVVAAGVPPLRAALLQFLVLQMAVLGSALTAWTAARLAWDRFFNQDFQVREEMGVRVGPAGSWTP
jgi:putative ABC transport system permease protein